ncbi:MAG: helix-turn-helix domain-containing protein [Lachnospiraceae bacterium]|nr:helix-turn-helix domain-containing protein [Lachnospiraceae bacterium]
MTLGEKLKSARKNAGLTQEQLSEKLLVSRQAVTKWESDKGMPDIENLKQLSKLLNVSIDYLLDSGETIDLSVIREEINLGDYNYKRKLSGRWVKKTGKKDMIVMAKYPDAEIHYLLGKQIQSRGEKSTNLAIVFFTNAPYGIPDFINGIKNMDKEFYLVNKNDKQFFVIVTDEFIESRQLAEKISEKKFKIGNFSFTDCGIISESKK